MAERKPGSQHLILFDGDCGFCRRAVNFISGSDTRRVFRFAPLLSQEGSRFAANRTMAAIGFGSLLVVPGSAAEGSAPLQKGAAVLFIIRRLGWPWRLLSLFRFVPLQALDWGYDRIARNRYLLSGGSASCPVPTGAGLDAGQTRRARRA